MIDWLKTLSLIVSTSTVGVHCAAADLILAENGYSNYQIVIADNASTSTRYGAEELQAFLQQMTGALLPIVSDLQPPNPKEIVLGESTRLKELGVPIELDRLGAEGYLIRTVGERLVIAGSQLRGNLYGVYGFLEDHLGCHWYTPSVGHIPKSELLAIGEVNDCQVPALEYRESFLFESFDGDWCARNRLNSSHAALEAKHGGKLVFADGFFAHSFANLVPPAKYFEKHPEYFALVRGERQRYQKDIPAQLCCTNPDVIRICTEGIRAAMRAQPSATVFSLSPNDCHAPTPDNDRFEPGWCECENCQTLAQKEGAQIAPVLRLVNTVAADIEKEFPDKLVETLAYRWTRHPPKHLRPRSNVVIRLCPIECCSSHSIATCDCEQSKSFRKDLSGWSAIAPRIWIWDYATAFAHNLLPFPNQISRVENISYFVKQGARGIFVQDTSNCPDSEMSALGAYLTAKRLWNPDYNCDRATREFLAAYYGPAAPSIQTYLELIHDQAAHRNIHLLALEVGPDSPHLNNELLVISNSLWQRAEESVADDQELLVRVKRSRMSVDYAILERVRYQATNELPQDSALTEIAAARFASFSETLSASDVALAEADSPPLEVYLHDLANDLEIPF